MDTEAEGRVIEKVIERLAERFPDLEHAHIEAVVHEEHERLVDNPVRTYVPALVEHAALERLRTEASPVPLPAGDESGVPEHHRPSKHPDPMEREGAHFPGLLNGGTGAPFGGGSGVPFGGTTAK